MPLLLLLATAQAASLSCAELQHMVNIGIPPATIVETIAQSSLPAAELPCVYQAGLPPAVVEAAERVAEGAEAPALPSPAPPTGPVQTQTVMQPVPFVLSAPTEAPGDPCSLASLMVTLPDPGAAAALSGTVGFGTGHFYAGRVGRGLTYLAIEGIATGLLLGARASDDLEIETRQALLGYGAAAFVIGRVADAVSAPYSARATGLSSLELCGR